MIARNDVVSRVRARLPELAGPDGRLPSERALAELLTVSRPALREGMRQLIDLGVLEARRGSGTFLIAPDLQELLVVRRSLEPLAARLAAEHADEEDRAEIAGLVVRLTAAQGEPGRFAEIDLQVHRAIANASRNRVLAACLDGLSHMLQASRGLTAGDPATRRGTADDLQRLSQAISAGDGQAAAAAMSDHLAHIGARLQPPGSGHDA